METGDTYVLGQIEWQLFGSLTWSGSDDIVSRKCRRALSSWFALARRVCRWHGLYFPGLLWAVRAERGEISGRPHLHFLMGGLPVGAASRGLCRSIEAVWDKKLHQGMARVRIFGRNPTDSGLAYLLEGLDCGDVYESSKFVDTMDRSVVVSRSVSGVIRSLHRRMPSGAAGAKRMQEPGDIGAAILSAR